MSETALRAMVRDVLREVLAGRGQTDNAPVGEAEAVRLVSDADLAAFVRRLIGLLDDPATGAAVRSGRHRFTLDTLEPATRSLPPAAVADHTTVLSGAVTEAKINLFAKTGTVCLAPDAVVTPMARDRIRALGLKIERKD